MLSIKSAANLIPIPNVSFGMGNDPAVVYVEEFVSAKAAHEAILYGKINKPTGVG